MPRKERTMTLQDAFNAHPTDVRWLVETAHVNLDDWDRNIAVTHLTDEVNDLYLGEDGETVFVVHGQAEPQLTCDAALWQIYDTEARWQEERP